MDLSLNGSSVVVSTPFSEGHSLQQIFACVKDEYLYSNNPIEFRAAGLKRKANRDIWHMDTVLSLSTDETPPALLNGEDIGGNHGFPCETAAVCPSHGKTPEDIGSLWRDEAGILWTLLKAEAPDRLSFVSENLGTDDADFRFAGEIRGTLSFVSDGIHRDPVRPEAQFPRQQMRPAVRFLRKDLSYEKDGARRPFFAGVSGADSFRMEEEYEIVNPATVADALRRGRPAGGYPAPPSLAAGDAMMNVRLTYDVADDGTVLCRFHLRLLDGRISWKGHLGIMYQVKSDVFDRGVWRVIPGVRPLTERGVTYDFSRPLNTSQDPFPNALAVRPEDWEDPSHPQDRQLDLIRGPGGPAFGDGDCIAGFAAGYLPVGDGDPAFRREHLDASLFIVGSRKTYPNFLGSAGGGGESFREMKGVAYKKYYLPDSRDFSRYTVACDGKTYLYGDFWASSPVSFPYEAPGGRAPLSLRTTGDVTAAEVPGGLLVRGTRGSIEAVFDGENH